MSAWLLLGIAIACEVVGTVAMRMSDGFTRPGPIAVVVAGYAVSFFLLAKVLQQLQVGAVYAIWAGTGTAIVAVIGILAFDESATAVKLVGVLLVVAGVVTLSLSGARH